MTSSGTSSLKSGFTLIEMSIVLVIIGLLVGGILTGQDLINAAAQRAQVAQIEKYNTAVNTFRSKYGYLPGDMPDPQASNFGFQPRGTLVGQGDGNGIIESNCNNSAGNNSGFQEGCGELAVFWEDLSEANLIDTTVFGHDTKGNGYPNITTFPGNITATSSPATIKDWLPTAKIGNNNFVYIYSFAGINYFAVSTVTKIGWNIESTANPGLTVQQAYAIDKKMDDGLPQSGSVTACYENFNVAGNVTTWAAGGLLEGANNGNGHDCAPTTAATVYASTNCYDNNNVASAQTYSISQNANSQNCALSFRFQ